MVATDKNQLFDPGFVFTPSDRFWLGRTVLPQNKRSQTTDDRQTTTDRQTTQRAKGSTNTTVGQKGEGGMDGTVDTRTGLGRMKGGNHTVP